MFRLFRCVIAAALLWFGSVRPTAATLVLNDGLTYEISANSEDIAVGDDASVNPTTVNVVDGANISRDASGFSAGVFGISTLNIFGGQLQGDVGAFGFASDGPSTLDLRGGTISGDVSLFEDTKATISGGTIDDNLEVFDRAIVWISGGTIGNDLDVFDDAQARVGGGQLLGDLTVGGNSIVTLFSSSIAGNVAALGDSLLVVYGTGFAINGTPVPLGPIGVDSGVLTGISWEGRVSNAFSIPFSRSSNAQIRLVATAVPEPSAFLFVGLSVLGAAAVGLIRRARARADCLQ